MRRSPQPLQANGPKVDVGGSPGGRCPLDTRRPLARWPLGGCGAESPPAARWCFSREPHPPPSSILHKNRKLERYDTIETVVCRFQLASLCDRWIFRGLFAVGCLMTAAAARLQTHRRWLLLGLHLACTVYVHSRHLYARDLNGIQNEQQSPWRPSWERHKRRCARPATDLSMLGRWMIGRAGPGAAHSTSTLHSNSELRQAGDRLQTGDGNGGGGVKCAAGDSRLSQCRRRWPRIALLDP